MRHKFGILVLAVIVAVGSLTALSLTALPAGATADQISIHQGCSGSELHVTFSWQGGQSGAVQEWLDLSLFDNGWQDATFIGAGPNTPRFLQNLTWPGLLQNASHYVRINEQRADGSWEPSRTFSFRTISCAGGAASPADGARVLAPIEVAHVFPTSNAGFYILHVVFGVPGCAKYSGFDISQSGYSLTIRIYNTIPSATAPCTTRYGTQEIEIGLGALSVGQTYNFDVNGKTMSEMPPTAGTGGHTH